MPRPPRLLLAAGGTGGHLFPGVAVAERARRDVDAAVLFVGTRGGLEKDVIPRLGFPLRFVPSEQLRGRSWWGKLRAVLLAGYGVGRAWRIIREFAPDVIFSIGGYASGPTVVAGWLRRIPCVLLEPNAVPGLANRRLSRFARRVCLGFEAAARFFPDAKVVQTGNPVRGTFRMTTSRPPAPAPSGPTFTVFVLGGSAGAHRLNVTAPAALAGLSRSRSGLRVVHQTGVADADTVRAAYTAAGVPARVTPFIDDMGATYAAADLVLCRAGAITLAELTVLGKPSILIPYPFAADDHQRANAEALVQAGAAVMVLDRALTPEALARTIDGLWGDDERLAGMARAAARMGRPEATAAVVETCLSSVEQPRTAGGEGT